MTISVDNPATAHQDALLRTELAFFAEHRCEWSEQHAGEFVLIGRETFAGFYRTHEQAMSAGLRMFGIVRPFLIRQVGAHRVGALNVQEGDLDLCN